MLLEVKPIGMPSDRVSFTSFAANVVSDRYGVFCFSSQGSGSSSLVSLHGGGLYGVLAWPGECYSSRLVG